MTTQSLRHTEPTGSPKRDLGFQTHRDLLEGLKPSSKLCEKSEELRRVIIFSWRFCFFQVYPSPSSPADKSYGNWLRSAVCNCDPVEIQVILVVFFIVAALSAPRSADRFICGDWVCPFSNKRRFDEKSLPLFTHSYWASKAIFTTSFWQLNHRNKITAPAKKGYNESHQQGNTLEYQLLHAHRTFS